MTPWFLELAPLAAHVGCDAVLDGEVVVLDERGHPDFDALRRRPATFIAFDVLRIGAHDLTRTPLYERRVCLRAIARDALPLVLV